MPSILISDISVNFPFQPYDVQQKYMEKVIECLRKVMTLFLISILSNVFVLFVKFSDPLLPRDCTKSCCHLSSVVSWFMYVHMQQFSRPLMKDKCFVKFFIT